MVSEGGDGRHVNMRSRATTSKHATPPSPLPSITSSSDSAWLLLSSPTVACLFLFLFRCVTSLCLRTYFNPDEPWQSLEPAYSYAFPPLGHRTWEWQPAARIRSHAHLLPFILLYRTLHALPLPLPAFTHLLYLHSPRLLQSALVAAADVRLWLLGKRLWGEAGGRWPLLCYECNWFLCYTLTRTYSNSMEAALDVIAMSYWPWPDRAGIHGKAGVAEERTALLFAALACCVRPTGLHIWMLLAAFRCYYLLSRPGRLLSFVVSACAICSVVLGLSLLLDRLMYGEWTVPAVNFFYLNSLTSLSSLYGTHPAHWYLTEALPATLTLLLPLAGWALWMWRDEAVVWLMCGVVGWSVLVHSLNAHKEYRFLLPVLPLVCLLAGRACTAMSAPRRQLVVVVYVAVNALLFGYLGLVHQAGPISAMSFLQHRLSSLTSPSSTVSPYAVHFWMQCHSTPVYSALHVAPPPSLRFLDCSPSLPPVSATDPAIAFSTHCTDSHLFHRSPLAFLLHYYNASSPPALTATTAALDLTDHCTHIRQQWQQHDTHTPPAERRGGGPPAGLPTHVVLFDNTLQAVRPLVEAAGYREVARLFHAHFGDERAVVVLEGLQHVRDAR